MSAKHHVDQAATQALIEQIDAAERKLRMMKQYINTDKGVVTDIQIVRGLYTGADDCIDTVGDLLIKFR
jgi:hypothetical protein